MIGERVAEGGVAAAAFEAKGGRMPVIPLPCRKKLQHQTPFWVADDAIFFVTICTEPRRLNQLCHPAVADRLRESVGRREELGYWWVPVLVLMPDHVHLLVSRGSGFDLARTVRAWKRYTSRWLGIRWQRDWFEHRLRDEESLEEKGAYILANPVRAGLVDSPEEWPYRWTQGF
jgi:putative transposase